jgi:hypothetical protein
MRPKAISTPWLTSGRSAPSSTWADRREGWGAGVFGGHQMALILPDGVVEHGAHFTRQGC